MHEILHVYKTVTAVFEIIFPCKPWCTGEYLGVTSNVIHVCTILRIKSVCHTTSKS